MEYQDFINVQNQDKRKLVTKTTFEGVEYSCTTKWATEEEYLANVEIAEENHKKHLQGLIDKADPTFRTAFVRRLGSLPLPQNKYEDAIRKQLDKVALFYLTQPIADNVSLFIGDKEVKVPIVDNVIRWKETEVKDVKNADKGNLTFGFGGKRRAAMLTFDPSRGNNG